MASEDDLSYLEPDFDPNNLTVAKLRGILLQHEIKYLSSAKKAQLVETFNTELKPKAKKILAQHARVKRSSRGIEDVPSSQASTVTEEDHEETAQSKRGRGRPRKAPKAAPREEAEDDTVVAPSATPAPRRRTTKAASVQPEPQPEPEPEPPRTAKQSRRKTRTPSVKPEDVTEPPSWHEHNDDSVFTDDNPFQSGSSPPTTSKKSRRKTDGPQEKERRRSTSRRRKTEQSPTKREFDHQFEVPITDLAPRGRRGKTPVQQEIDITEEFEPEAQLELEQDRRAGRTAVIPVTRSQRRQPTDPTLKNGVFAILVVLFATFAALYRTEKLKVGYCGVGRPSDRIAGVDIPDWAEPLRPTCERCPQHGTCYENLETECHQGFVLKHHPLSGRGIIPLPPTCEPDGERAKRIKNVADRGVDALRVQNAKAECGEPDGNGEPTVNPTLSEDELKAKLVSLPRKRMSDEEFEDLWDSAVSEIAGRKGEIHVTTDEASGTRSFRSSSLAKVSFRCSINRSISKAVERYTFPALSLLGLIFGAVYLNWSYQAGRTTEKQAKQLATEVFGTLAEYAADIAYDSSTRDGYISVPQLRDDVLRDEFSAAKRTKLWKRVEQLVEQNSNVRAKVGTLDTGDVGRGWKWIGPVRAIEDGGSGVLGGKSVRRSTSRYSLGPVPSSSPVMELKTPGYSDESSFSRWEDSSRPVY